MPSSTPKYNLKWQEFRAAVSSSFGMLRSDTELCDVTLVSEEEDLVMDYIWEQDLDIFEQGYSLRASDR